MSIASRSALGSLLAALALGAGACDASGGAGAGVATQTSAIVGGTADTGDEAVMALVHQQGASAEECSGTTIATVGESGIFLTAAHCVVASDGNGHITMPISVANPADLYVIPGPDWSSSLGMGLYYGVAAVTVDPSYDGNVNSPYDVALVRFVGATATQPTIPALTPAEDTLAAGAAFTLVGYGKTTTTSTAANMNTVREKVDRTVSTLTSAQFEYTQTDDKGACSGDSGGPALVQTPDGVRVAGITSFGDPNCNMLGVSVRVSSASTVIASFIAAAPQTLDCNDCTLAVVGPGNTCIAQGEVCGDQQTECGQFLACADACQTNSCVSACETKYAAGASAYAGMIACQCGACSSVCASNPNCGGTGTGAAGSRGTGAAGPTGAAGAGGVIAPGACGGVTDPRPLCAACIQSQCCAQGTACSNEAICASCLQSDASTCRFNATLSSLTTCIASCPACDTGATGAAGGTGAAGTSSAATGAAGTPAANAAGKSGCSCATSGSSGTPAGSLAGLAALALFARRGRRRRF